MTSSKYITKLVILLFTLSFAPLASTKPYIAKAGRSPIPTYNESIDSPLPFRRLLPEEKDRPPVPTSPILWYEAPIQLCRTITIDGTVIRSRNIGGLTFLNFSEDWKNDFTVVVFQDAYADTPTGDPTYYNDKTVRITGRVSMYRGKTQIEIRDGSKIKVIAKRDTTKPSNYSLPAWLTAKGETPDTALPDDVIWWTNAPDYMGETITFQAKVLVTKDIGNLTFLNFSEQWKDKFHAIIFKSTYDQYDAMPDQLFLGKTVQITAKINKYRGRPQAVVNSAKDIKIIDADSDQKTDRKRRAEIEKQSNQNIANSQDIISWSDAGQFIGSKITAEGTIVRGKDIGSRTFLNFSNDWKGSFTLVIPKVAYDKLKEEYETDDLVDFFINKTIHVTGKVTEYRGTPQIQVKTATQIKIQD
ncbi:hypothetical protein [Poriferisphaera sp. WC338]|uniref:hypothetical protein n=1 Tax=Poriferisphaera sp. WC338 TaxID=3425129 RepID=UPI003D81A1EA